MEIGKTHISICAGMRIIEVGIPGANASGLRRPGDKTVNACPNNELKG